ncbi:3-oxoacyl-[acyl-carrier protein] reductase [Singulisphaera sp. GP187]|uniref:3-oxoacyl-ACP reductase FabG n=1 Tax=Singulisphaera sp. GP187 TaxID=1882752 RepID=UPI00092815B2|nr:3-oxoacyl-ACP reductase FabG [Singulisphaera sp. GP187]SIO00030.1 3-oxoacyl-[acyl-carrier protein] reductase [Singulisphaera sp. GP187]
MSIEIDLAGKRALVTGASQGIGAQIARTLHQAGCLLILNHPDLEGGRTKADADALADELCRQRPGSALVYGADVADPTAVEAMMRSIEADLGGIDALICNAGILRDRTIAKMSIDEWRSVIDVNLSGVFYCCKFGLEILRDGGTIVNMGSLSASAGFHGQSNYAAAKSGVQALTRVLSRECAKRSIRVNAIAPGLIETAMSATLSEAVRTEMHKAIPWRKFGDPQDVANAVLFLCSPLAGYITGHVLEVNGGWRG